MCAAEFEKVVGDGRGFGLAFAADQTGYPGPMHVLEFQDRLKLTADQEAKVQGLMHAMFAESRPKSARLLEAEARLFAERVADEGAVRGAVAEVERARSEVRLVHLLTHLKDARPPHGGPAPALPRGSLGRPRPRSLTSNAGCIES